VPHQWTGSAVREGEGVFSVFSKSEALFFSRSMCNHMKIPEPRALNRPESAGQIVAGGKD